VKIELSVKNVQVLVNLPGTDEVHINLSGPSPFPAMGYDGVATIKTQKGEGVRWCREVLGVEPSVVDCNPGIVS